MFILPGILFGIQLSTAYHALLLCYLALCIAHASAVRVYGIALYLWFSHRFGHLMCKSRITRSLLLSRVLRGVLASSGAFIPALVRASQDYWVGYCCIHTLHGHRLHYCSSCLGCEFRTRVMNQVVDEHLFSVGFVDEHVGSCRWIVGDCGVPSV